MRHPTGVLICVYNCLTTFTYCIAACFIFFLIIHSILVQRKILALWNPPMKIFCVRHWANVVCFEKMAPKVGRITWSGQSFSGKFGEIWGNILRNPKICLLLHLRIRTTKISTRNSVIVFYTICAWLCSAWVIERKWILETGCANYAFGSTSDLWTLRLTFVRLTSYFIN